MSDIKPSSTPIGRGAGFERSAVTLLGLLSLLVGIAAIVVGSGVLGMFRSRRPVADPLLVQWLRDNARLAAAELTVARNYGLTLLAITPMALGMRALGGPVDVGELVAWRAIDTALGVAVAVVLLLATHRLRAGLAR